ncbi:MAG: ParB/RepB/Spo0J family partition protein [Euryarchaeota archaeon]|nr:ParB/RepB/Spo0J family partition protein [Euryarchaeota archaeon]
MPSQDVNTIVHLPVKEVWADPDFNCRGHIAPIDVVDLSKDIEAHGLQQPISVKSIKNGESQNTTHKYKVITGHRRHKAFELLNRETVPCVINNKITESAALILNLGENLHRKDLNIMQEANALERLKLTGFSVVEVSRQLNKSTTWVNVRYMLLELPDAIREAAAAGYINQAQVRDLHSLGDYKKQIEAAKKIKQAKARGEKAPKITRKKRDMFKRKPRDVDDIFYMQDHIQDAIGNNFGTRCLAWAVGEISDLELYRDIQEIAARVDIDYKIPYDKAKQVDREELPEDQEKVGVSE